MTSSICFWIALAALPVIVALYAIHRIERGIERLEAQIRELEPDALDEISATPDANDASRYPFGTR